MGLITLQEKDEIGRIGILKKLTRWLFVTAMSLFVGIYSKEGSVDYENYTDFLEGAPAFAEWTLFSLKDPFFQSLGAVFASSNGNLAALTFVTTFLSLGIKMKILVGKYYENIFALAVLFLVGRFFLLHEFTQIRASLGIAFISLAVIFGMHGKWFWLILAVVIAAFTHLSTIALLPIILLTCDSTPRIKLFIFLFGILVFSLIGLESDVIAFTRLDPYLSGDYVVTENTLVNFYFVFKALMVLTLLFQWKSLSPGIRCALMVSVYGLFLTLIFLQNNVLSLRFGELTAVFDCICFAYCLKYSCMLEPFYAYCAGLMLVSLLYFSSTNIVNPIQSIF